MLEGESPGLELREGTPRLTSTKDRYCFCVQYYELGPAGGDVCAFRLSSLVLRGGLIPRSDRNTRGRLTDTSTSCSLMRESEKLASGSRTWRRLQETRS